jgi:hypothetical protein
MIDFNTSKQMQKLNTGISDSSKERNSPLSLNRQGFSMPPSYSPLALGFNSTAVSAMNTLFNDAQKAAELSKSLDHKSQSPLIIETSKANSPKISQSPNARQNIIHSTANFQPQNKPTIHFKQICKL